MTTSDRPQKTHSRDVSASEAIIARSLRQIVRDLAIGEKLEDSHERSAALSALERFIPEVLAEKYPEWNSDSIDGVIHRSASKTQPLGIEMAAQCIRISDQVSLPMRLHLQIHPEIDMVIHLECALGIRGTDGNLTSKLHNKHLNQLDGHGDPPDWFYTAHY